jgi:FtsZ-binding cell division protein ZapB
MAFTTDSRHQPRLLREMARHLDKADTSCASSTGSHHGTVSDSSENFDPDNPDEEVFQSTQQMNFDLSPQLPGLRDTAKKYARWNGGRQPEFVINTSALGRAFPDFTQGGSSDDSMNIEVGRGSKTRQRGQVQTQAPGNQYSDDVDSPVITIGNVQILGTPPVKSQTKTSKAQDAPRNSLRKESQGKRIPSVRMESIKPLDKSKSSERVPGYVSGATISSNGEQRRTLAELHAKVVDESDASYISEGRPAAVHLATKNSRFTNFQQRKSPLAQANSFQKQPITDAVVDALAGRRQALQEETPSRPESSSNANTNTLNPTAQSFLLPNMPEISELVSTAGKETTPVFTRGGRVQTRFSSASIVSATKENHAPVDGIPVPGDEKAIFLSLELLQERVAALEMEKADSQRAMEQVQSENYRLQAETREFRQRRRSDSALGDSGSDAEHVRDNKKLIAEKTSKWATKCPLAHLANVYRT